MVLTNSVLPIRLLLVLGALSAFGPLSLDLYLPALPALAEDFGGPASAAQLTMTACMIGLAAGQVLVGPLSDRFGRRKPLLIGVGAFGLVSILCAFAPTVGVLIALRFVQGVAGGAGIVIARAIVRDLCDTDNAAQVFSLLMVVTGVAPVLAPVLGGQLLRLGPWQGTFLALSLIGCALLVAAALGVPETLPSNKRVGAGLRGTGAQLREALCHRQFVAATAVLALGSAILFSYIAMSPFVLQTQFGLSAQAFSLVFALNSSGLLLGGFAGARLVRRWGSASTLVVGLAVALLDGMALVLAASVGAALPVLVPLLFLTVSSASLIMPTATALGLAHQGAHSGMASGVMGMFQFGVAGAVAPVVSYGGATALTMAITMAVTAAAALAVHVVALRPSITAIATAPGRSAI